MKNLLKIIEKAGYKPTDENIYLKVHNHPFMDLVIEWVGHGPHGHPAISVAHYGESNGDLMQDPEMCFEVYDDFDGVRLWPYYYRNAWLGVEQTVVDQHKQRSLCRDLASFAATWDANLADYVDKVVPKEKNDAEQG